MMFGELSMMFNGCRWLFKWWSMMCKDCWISVDELASMFNVVLNGSIDYLRCSFVVQRLSMRLNDFECVSTMSYVLSANPVKRMILYWVLWWLVVVRWLMINLHWCSISVQGFLGSFCKSSMIRRWISMNLHCCVMCFQCCSMRFCTCSMICQFLSNSFRLKYCLNYQTHVEMRRSAPMGNARPLCQHEPLESQLTHDTIPPQPAKESSANKTFWTLCTISGKCQILSIAMKTAE